MTTFNLLPKGLRPKESLIKLSSSLKKTSLIGYIALVILALAFIGGFLVLSNQFNSVTESQVNLKTRIETLEVTEQRLVLIKDRLAKVDQVLEVDSSSTNIENLEKFMAIFPEGAVLIESSITPARADVSVTIISSKVLAEFLASLLASGIYSKVILGSLSFNPDAGYGVLLTLTI